MADVKQLIRGATVVDLNDRTKHYVASRGQSMVPAWTDQIVQYQGQSDAYGAHSQAGALQITARLNVLGTSVNTLIANHDEIDTLLMQARAYQGKRIGGQVQFKYQPEGASNPVLYDVIGGRLNPPTQYEGIELKQFYEVGAQLLLICRPFGKWANEQTAASGDLTSYGSWTPTAFVGTQPAPVRVRVKGRTTAQTHNYIRVAAKRAMVAGGNVGNFIHEYQAGKSAPSGYTITLPGGASRTGEVQINLRAKDPGGTAKTRFKVVWRNAGGTVYDLPGTQDISTDGTGAWAAYTRMAWINPQTHLPWLASEVNAGSFGVQMVGSGVAGAPTIASFTAGPSLGAGTLANGDYYCKVTALDPYGESVGSAVASLNYTGQGNPAENDDYLRVVINKVTGAASYRVYIASAIGGGADPGDASRFYAGSVNDSGGATTTLINIGPPGGGATVPTAQANNKAFVSKLQRQTFYPDRDLVNQSSSQDPNGDQAPDNWTKQTGGQATWQNLTSGNDTKWIESTTVGQQSFVTYPSFTEAGGADGGVRAQFAPLLRNGGFEGSIVPYTTGQVPCWSVTGAPAVLENTTDKQDGASCLQINSAGSASATNVFQTLGCVGGATYRFRIRLGLKYSSGGVTSLNAGAQLTSNGTSPVPLVFSHTGTPSGSGASNPLWSLFVGTFTAPNDATQLTVTIWGGTGVDSTHSALFDAAVLMRDDATASELVRFGVSSNLSDQIGHYRAHVRARSTGATVPLQVRYGGPLGRNAALNAYASPPVQATVAVNDLGRLDIPERDWTQEVTLSGTYRWSLWTAMTPFMDAVSTNAQLDIDAATLWPTDDNLYLEFLPVTNGTGPTLDEYAVCDPEGRLVQQYHADSGGNEIEQIRIKGSEFYIEPGTYRFFLAMSREATNDVRADQGAIDIQYAPRVGWFRGA